MYKVLLVDDEYMVTEAQGQSPLKNGRRVVATTITRRHALTTLAQKPVRIISDVNMPDKTGT